MAETRIKSSGLSANITVSNLALTGTTSVSGNVVPTSNNTVNLGSPTLRFGSLYLSGNTIDIGGAQITTTTGGDLSFNTASGNVAITANTVSFLTTVANTTTTTGNVSFSSNLTATSVKADAYFYTNGAAFTGGAGAAGYTGSQGSTGLGFSIAKSYASVAALTADTSPTGITAGQFAVIETGSVQDADNAKLYLWSGSTYSYVTDLSGAAGITGPAGTTGYTGSAGSAGTVGYTGSRGTTAFTAGNTAPVSPGLGDMWYRTTNDALYRYLNDGTTSYWIDVTGPVNNFGTSATTLAAITASGAAPPPTVGQFYGGGYYAGSISATGNGVATHYLIVAPKSTGETSGLTWGPQGVTTGATSVINGPSNSAILAGLGSSYQAATWCEALSINGYTDWYLPSKNELEVMYYFLKPGTGNNDIASGANPNAVSPEPSNTNYNYTVPGQTSATAFRTGASDQQLVELMYWSSTQFSDNYAFVQKFQNGEQLNDRYKDDTYLKNVRAVRRIAI